MDSNHEGCRLPALERRVWAFCGTLLLLPTFLPTPAAGRDPLVSDEFEIGTPHVGPANTCIAPPAYGWGETNGLVVWSVDFDWPMGTFASRVDEQGRLLDALPVSISTEGFFHASPVISWNGSSFLVVWANSDDRLLFSISIYAARVSQDGIVLDPEVIPISTRLGYISLPSVTWDGANHLVAWLDDGNGIQGVRVDPNGVVLDDPPIDISADFSAPDLSSSGADNLVVWASGQSVQAARISSSGELLDPDGFSISLCEGTPSSVHVARSSGIHLVVWMESDVDWIGPRIRGARVDDDGSVLDPAGFDVISGGGSLLGIGIACSGDQCLLVWPRDFPNVGYTDIQALRLMNNGHVLDERPFDVSDTFHRKQSATVEWTGRDYLVLWVDFRNGLAPTIYGNRVGLDGTLRDRVERAYSVIQSQRFFPTTIWNGERFIVAWSENRIGSGVDVHGAHVANTIDPQIGAAFPISTAYSRQWQPTLGWNGREYLAAWSDLRTWSENHPDLFASRVNMDGTVQDLEGFYIHNQMTSQKVACSEGDCLVVFESGDLLGALVPMDALSVSPDVFWISSASSAFSRGVVWNGSHYLVVWRQGSTIKGARGSSTGELLYPDGVSIVESASDRASTSLDWNGSGYLLAWTGNGGIYGVRLGPSGQPLNPDGFTISADATSPSSVHVAWGGESYLVAWEEHFGDDSFQIFAARVNADAEVLDDPAILVAETNQEVESLSITSDGAGNWLLCYHGIDDSVGWQLYNIFGRRITALILGQLCETDDECSSGHCADGVCCDAACDRQCEACDQEDILGTCAPVTGDPRGDRLTCPGTGLCRSTCDGLDPASCNYPGAEQPCADGWCVDGVQADQATCDGEGRCRPPRVHDCGPYICGENTCRVNCTENGHCAEGYICSGAACRAQPDAGIDGGDTGDTPPLPSDGCGCQPVDGPGSGAWLWILLALAGLALPRCRWWPA